MTIDMTGMRGRHRNGCVCVPCQRTAYTKQFQPMAITQSVPEAPMTTQNIDMAQLLAAIQSLNTGNTGNTGNPPAQTPQVTPPTPAIDTGDVTVSLAVTHTKSGFSKAVDGRGLPQKFDLTTEQVPFGTMYINPAGINGRQNGTITISASKQVGGGGFGPPFF